MINNNILNNLKGWEDFLYIAYKKNKEFKKIKSEKYQEIIKSTILTKEQKKGIDDFFIANYGEKIPYDWHRFYTAISGVYDCSYFPEYLYYPYFEHLMNYNKSYAEVFEDKHIIPFVAKSAHIKMPQIIVSKSDGIFRDTNNTIISFDDAVNILQNYERFFYKPATIACGGRGCFILDSNINNYSSYFKLGDNFIIQEVIDNSKSIKYLYPKSVNTFRITSYRWKDSFHIMPIAMRIGMADSVVDNASNGGLFVAISNEGKLIGNALSLRNECYKSHPDTNIVFNEYTIDNFAKCIEAAKKMHSMLPMLGVIGWDFTIDSKGEPILIEANIRNASYRLGQIAHGISAFENRTSEVLQWIRKIKNTPYKKRHEFAFGNI